MHDLMIGGGEGTCLITACVTDMYPTNRPNNEIRRFGNAVMKTAYISIEREPRTVIHVKRAKLFDPMV